MRLNEFIEQCLEDYRRRVYAATAPLTEEEMHWRPDAESNSIAFLIWHTARVEDRLINVFARGADEVWTRDDWSAKTGIPEGDHGVNYTLEQVAALPPHHKGTAEGILRRHPRGDLALSEKPRRRRLSTLYPRIVLLSPSSLPLCATSVGVVLAASSGNSLAKRTSILDRYRSFAA